jgi:hypothetical protein
VQDFQRYINASHYLEIVDILKLVVAVTLFITIPVIAFAQKESPTKTAPKPTIAQVRKLVSRLSKLFGE